MKTKKMVKTTAESNATKVYRVTLRKTVISVVSVEAGSAAEARVLVDGGDWDHDQEVDLVDWEITGVKEES